MSVLPLSKLSDWELEDASKDLRGLKLVDRGGRTIGTIDELLVDTDRARVDSVRTDDGRLFAVEPLEIRNSEVVFQDEPAARDDGPCCGPITLRAR